jgi:hypothetical protein
MGRLRVALIMSASGRHLGARIAREPAPHRYIAFQAKNRARIPEIFWGGKCPFSRDSLFPLDLLKSSIYEVVVAWLERSHIVSVGLEDVSAG